MADYVIVGGGTAGCVLAARLSEDEAADVILVEAGPSDDLPEIRTPALLGFLFKTHLDWDLSTDAEPGLDFRQSELPRGRMLGGTSSINGMVYVRGNQADFGEWAEIGGREWDYEHLLPYFMRSEDNERGEDRFHGVGGPLGVSDLRSGLPFSDIWIEAAIQAGFDHNPDFNGAFQDGVGPYQLTQRDGERSSTSSAFLTPNLDRRNLAVITDAHATRVLFEGSRAVGVEVLRHGSLEVLRAEREVIVAAGAYHSPQLLMLSGVGPAPHLAAFGIEVREDLPVGENLLDHAVVLMSWTTSVPGIFSSFTPENLELYQREHRGPFACNMAEVGGFVSTRPGLVGPDIQLHASSTTYHPHGQGSPFADGCTFGPNLAKATSVGTVTLRSAMPTAKPRILHNFLMSAEDQATMLAGMRLTLDIADQPALRGVLVDPYLVPSSRSDEDIMDFVRRYAQTNFHAGGTCAIGTVVDPQLRVLGVDALRVVDASVMPTLIRGNTNAPTIAIAEKAADLIRGRTAPPAHAVKRATAAGR